MTNIMEVFIFVTLMLLVWSDALVLLHVFLHEMQVVFAMKQPRHLFLKILTKYSFGVQSCCVINFYVALVFFKLLF